MSKKKPTKKAPAKKAPAKQATAARVIDFNSLLGNWPQIQLGDQTFEGRHVNQTEKPRYADIENRITRSRDRAEAALRVTSATEARLYEARRRGDTEAAEELEAHLAAAKEDLQAALQALEEADRAQLLFVVEALNARGATVDEEWVKQWPDEFLMTLIRGLHGFPWPGEEVGAEGK